MKAKASASSAASPAPPVAFARPEKAQCWAFSMPSECPLAGFLPGMTSCICLRPAEASEQIVTERTVSLAVDTMKPAGIIARIKNATSSSASARWRYSRIKARKGFIRHVP